MNAFDRAECHRLVHDRGLKEWKFRPVQGNQAHPVSQWLTLWDNDDKIVCSIARMANSKNYCAHAQRMQGDNTWVAPTPAEVLAIALDKWLAYQATA